MYHNAAYTDAQSNIDYPFWINSCGHEADFDNANGTTRPAGRTDYLFLLTTTGVLEVYFKDSHYICPAGCAVLYGPNKPQHYKHIPDTNPSSMWIHFSGKEVANLLNRLQLSTESIYKIAYPGNLVNLITELITELQTKDTFYTDSASIMLQNILLYVAKNSIRTLNINTPTAITNSYEIRVPSDVSKIVTYLNEHYTEPIEINKIAQQLQLSHCRFIQLFKKFESVTPKQYIINLRIKKARDFLENSALSIEEIAIKVGYPNPLYFSRIFKKCTGLSPTAYRMKYY